MSKVEKRKSLKCNGLYEDIVEEKLKIKKKKNEKIEEKNIKYKKNENYNNNNDEYEDDEKEAQILPSKITKKILQTMQEQQNDKWECESVCSSIDIKIHEEGEKLKGDEEGFVFGDYKFEEEEENFGNFFEKKKKEEKNENEEDIFYFNKSRNLADLILQKIDEKKEREKKEQNIHNQLSNELKEKELEEEAKLTRIEEVYKKIGQYLKVYKSGKIPKAFKILPRIENWENILYITNPIQWSPQAMYAATKIFSSNFNEKLAQRFYNLVLLPAVRESISAYKKLNYHYYESLKKALFKPAAWLKGILLPLLQDGCNLRECVIVGSIIAKISIPPLHSAACIIKLCRMEPWTSPISYILSILINKRYSLPYKVIEELVDHFCRFSSDERTMPVVWHQSFLYFVQRYKYELTDSQHARLMELLRKQQHSKISVEIRREMQIGLLMNNNTQNNNHNNNNNNK